VDGAELPLRRSRGYAPQPIALPFECPQPILAVGGQLKATFALGRDRHAFLSHHLGDLDHYDAYQAFTKHVTLYEQLFSIQPTTIAHDMHPDYVSTHYAHERIGRVGEEFNGHGMRISGLPVQHHHAHMASCMAEHGLREAVIGVIFDGTGYGTDGASWGGEFLTGDYRSFQRVAHLRYIGLPGGDQAIREPWRMAVAHAAAAGVETAALDRRIDARARRIVAQLLERRLHTPLTSSVGRLFDAVAALIGVRDRVSYEGQAAMELEWLATDAQEDGAYPFEVRERIRSEGAVLEIDPAPLIRAVVQNMAEGVSPARIGRRFHSGLVEMIVGVCERIRRQTGLSAVVLSGGVFHNVILVRESSARLEAEGFRVYRHRQVPAGDGGLSLGQLAVAAARCEEVRGG
jgi:hydrogenase maturation protein HypF